MPPKFSQGVPIEVVPFAYAKVLQNLRNTLGSSNAILRMAKMKAGPVVSDNANFIIDAPFATDVMKDPSTVRVLPYSRFGNCADGGCGFYEIMTRIKMLTGVVEVGLFCNMAKAAYFGNEV